MMKVLKVNNIELSVKGKREFSFRVFLLAMGILCSAWGLSFAETTGASFLKIGVGARPVSLGSGYTALADDSNAIAWNPGGLHAVRQAEVTALFAQHLEGSQFAFLGYARPIAHGRQGVMGFSYTTLRVGEIEGRDENRNKTTNFKAQDFAASLAYSRKIHHSAGVGVNLKFIRQSIAEHSASAPAMDLGFQSKLPIRGVSMGLSVQNMGPEIKFIEEGSKLPLMFRGAAAWTISGTGLTVVTGATRYVYENRNTFSVGTEYWIGGSESGLALRGRYGFDRSVRGSGADLSSIAAGAGFRFKRVQLDYAFVPFTDFDNTHRFSVTLRFGSRYTAQTETRNRQSPNYVRAASVLPQGK